MLSALSLALRQLGDPSLLRILAKCIGISLLVFAVLAMIGGYAIDWLLGWAGLDESLFAGGDAIRKVTTLILLVISGWLLWRIVAMAVLQFYADEVVQAVEARHYPAALEHVRPLGWRRELAISAKGARRALFYNLLTLPFALVLLITGFGTALLFLAVNAVLLGRELTELVWLRHVHEPDAPLPLERKERWLLGGLIAGLLLVPFANFLAPVLGAAMATHLVHGKGAIANAR